MAHFRWNPSLAVAVVFAIIAMPLLGQAQDAAIPNFSPSSDVGWIESGTSLLPPLSGLGPVMDDTAHPYVANNNATGAQPTFHVADLSNPILQPWVREELRKRNERILSGKPAFNPQASCLPNGVPSFLLHAVVPTYIIQSPKEVVMISQEDIETRHIHLNVPHAAQVIPSWAGDSIGHYEGDTLVVDTIGLNARTYVDNFRTPHTDKLHVVERFHLVAGGKTLEVNLYVEDTGAFTAPWTAIQRFRRVEQGPIFEASCAENNANYFNLDMQPIPQDDRPVF